MPGNPEKKQYRGVTFGLRAMGIPVYEDESLGEGTIAMVRPGERAIYVNPRRGLTRESAEHELTHLRQMASRGLLGVPTLGVQQLLALIRGRDPTMETPMEREAYAREDLTRAREAAEWQARVGQYAADKRKAGRAKVPEVRGK